MISATLVNTHTDIQTNCFCPVILVDQPDELKKLFKICKVTVTKTARFLLKVFA